MGDFAKERTKKLRIRSKLKRNNRSGRKRIFMQVTNKHLRAQLIDDTSGKTLFTVTTASMEGDKKKNRSNKEFAVKLAEEFAGKVTEQKIAAGEGYVFDRGGKIYHGKVSIFAETLREKGLVF